MTGTKLAAQRHVRCDRTAFSLFEVTAATAMLGLVVAGALEGVAVARRLGAEHDAKARGALLAQEFLAEVAGAAYADPQLSHSALGIEAGETFADRSTLDDVDDYQDFAANDPRDRQGQAMIGYDGWSVEVQVSWVRLDDPAVESSSETGLKRITVTALSPVGLATSLTTLRARSGPLDQPQPVARNALVALGGAVALRSATDARRVAAPLANQAPDAPD